MNLIKLLKKFDTKEVGNNIQVIYRKKYLKYKAKYLNNIYYNF